MPTTVRAHTREGRPVRRHYRMAVLQNEERASLLRHRSSSQLLVRMTPDEYLRLVGGPPLDSERQPWRDLTVYRTLRDRIANGEPVDALFFDVNVNTGQIESHEGRHRAILAKELGIETVPVILYHRNDEGYVPIRRDPYHREAEVVPIRYTELLPQRRRL